MSSRMSAAGPFSLMATPRHSGCSRRRARPGRRRRRSRAANVPRPCYMAATGVFASAALTGSAGRLCAFHVIGLHMASDDPHWRRPRSYHHGNLKQVLLEAARKLIEQHGPVGFSLTEAARLAGVSPAAPYRHFRDRDALLAEVARNGFERFAAKLDAAWNNGIPTPLSAFGILGRAYLAFAREEPASYAVMFESGIAQGDDPQLKAAADRAFNVLERAATALCQMLPASERPPIR